ncbi:GT-D fold domain-containing glycosyltransferase [Paenibacillus polymyxa]|uniref:GT-D fold domain-containing glycosyltransferase n=1 Tax=Paenibacillus polymyxa TaxID=1406 RepID=UPI0004DEFB6B|nr:GT-D fold domain-containing glycosyltransferase [Paenibacillus polymyxa]
MIISLESVFSNVNVCTKEESDFILDVMSKLNKEDLAIVEEKNLCHNIKIQYDKTIHEWIQKKAVQKKKIEDSFVVMIQEKHNNDIQRIRGSESLYRIEIYDTVHSSMIIFSLNIDTIKVHKRENNFVKRTTDVSIKLSQIEASYPQVLSTSESIAYIMNNECSLARYGDGELNLCYGIDIGFQKGSLKLQKRLREILNHGSDNKILVTLPEFNSRFNNITNCNGQISFWENYWLKMYDNLKDFFTQPFYGNTDVSRNSVFFENSLAEIKQLWKQREVVFLIGRKGRFEIKSDLFNNVKNFEIIYVPPVNAFDTYPQIIEVCLKVRKDKLFLISAGPTATVLAYDLMNYGYQALDIGHLPNCYDQYLGIIKYPESIPHVRPDAVHNEAK